MAKQRLSFFALAGFAAVMGIMAAAGMMIIQDNSEKTVLQLQQNVPFFANAQEITEEPLAPEQSPEDVPPPEEVPQEFEGEGRPGGGCLIATATYGSEMAPQVQMLREIRDNKLQNTESGSVFMEGFNEIYYSFSPAVAEWERQNPALRDTVKVAITPLISSLSLLQFVDMEGEAQVLGYGIGIISLNLGMYVAAPAILISRGTKLVRNRQNKK